MSIRFEDFRDPARLVLMAGPCVIESEEHVNKMADAISGDAGAAGLSLRIQGFLRQSQPHEPEGISRTRADGRVCGFWAICASAVFPSSRTFMKPRR